jgi:hypothetical protein
VGDAGRLRPHRSVCDEEAQLTPLGKRVSWSGKQLTHTEIATIFKKELIIKPFSLRIQPIKKETPSFSLVFLFHFIRKQLALKS